jgi:REP element-mobilizing transposase RayT
MFDEKRFPQRKKLRLHGHDYSQNGAYFVTICVKDKHPILGSIASNVGAIINRPQAEACMQIKLSEHGMIVDETIKDISKYYPYVAVDKYVIMPNHIHMILIVNDYDCDGRLIIAPTCISTVIKQLKRHVSKRLGFSMWQKSFHDRIIRNEEEYRQICKYIDENPSNWEYDEYCLF